MRKYNLEAKKRYMGIRIKDEARKSKWIAIKLSLEQYGNYGLEIYKLCVCLVENYCSGLAVSHVQVIALNSMPINKQLDLFTQPNLKKQALNKDMDKINAC